MSTDQQKITEAFDLLEEAEVMHVFEDCVWISVDKETWESFTGTKLESEVQA